MVCPYKVCCTLVSAVLSIFYVASAFADADEQTTLSNKAAVVPTKKPMSAERRMITVALLVIFHIDLLFTGYLRAGFKEGVAVLASKF